MHRTKRKQAKTFNPFYPLLVVVGIMFCVTACGYGVMSVRKLRNPLEENPPAFIEWMDQQGFTVMMVELAALGVLSFAAMATDSFWSRQAASAPPLDDRKSNAGNAGNGDLTDGQDQPAPENRRP